MLFRLIYLSRCAWEQAPDVLCGASTVAVDLTQQRCLRGVYAATTIAERQLQSGLVETTGEVLSHDRAT